MFGEQPFAQLRTGFRLARVKGPSAPDKVLGTIHQRPEEIRKHRASLWRKQPGGWGGGGGGAPPSFLASLSLSTPPSLSKKMSTLEQRPSNRFDSNTGLGTVFITMYNASSMYVC